MKKTNVAVGKLSAKIKLAAEKLKGMREQLKELKVKNRGEKNTLKKPGKKKKAVAAKTSGRRGRPPKKAM